MLVEIGPIDLNFRLYGYLKKAGASLEAPHPAVEATGGVKIRMPLTGASVNRK